MPLPLPADATPSTTIHVNARVQLHAEGEVRAVVAGGIPLVRYSESDDVSAAFAMVTLVQAGLASVTEVARGFETTRPTVYRAMKNFGREGFGGLAAHKPGPKGPRLLGDASLRRTLALKRQGATNVAIAVRLGVSEATVRSALKRAGFVADVPEQVALLIEEGTPSLAQPDAEELAPTESGATKAPAEPIDASGATETKAEDPDSRTTLETDTAHVQPELELDAAAHGDAGGMDPWDRSADRVLARLGLMEDASPQFGACAHVRGAGVLLALPALISTGLFDVAQHTYQSLGPAFYGVRAVFVALAFMALLRIKRPEMLRHQSPVDLGRLLGLDRAPEVKTLRRKIGILAARRRSEEFFHELARRRAATYPDVMGFLYTDGHVRVYSGKHDLPKAHVTRMRLSMPATVDHWVNDRDGEPLFVVTATPTGSMARELPPILAEIRAVVGERRVTVVFDRGGWSPKLFAQMMNAGFDVLTYRKGRIPKVRRSRFVEHKGEFEGRQVSYQLAERELRLLNGRLRLREVVRLSEDGKHQTSIVTSRRDLSTVEVAYRMFSRWRQENFFKYMGDEFELDALVTYGTEDADAERLVPNPARKAKERELAKARGEVAELERALGEAAARNEEARRPTMRGFKIANGEIGKALRAARERVDRLRAEKKGLAERVTARDAAQGGEVVRLRTDAKRLTDAIKSVAYQAETSLVRMIRGHYVRHEDEGRKLVASAMALSGDLSVVGCELHISLEPAASPNRTRAIARLCEEMSATDTVYPGTSLVLRFAIREA